MLILATILALFVIMLNTALGGKISAFVRDIVAPLENAGGKIGSFITNSGYFTTRGALEAQITALQAEVQQDQLQAAAFSALQQENQSLTSLVHLTQTSQGLAASIISSIVSSPYGTFSIGAGSADAVSNGSMVLASDGFVIGRIEQVQAHQSIVNELFASGVQTPVSLDGSAVVVFGQGGQGVAEVAHGITVLPGDPAIAPGFGGRPIGIVEHVDSNPANAQQAVYIALPVSLSSIEYVYVTP